mmetsp:Transcript_18294/g.30509  ORF Transcript_18294/g.30509 Transcript_18294/m.30509 type:complete len:429 (+) Transcript_18294:66-1352(+)
MLRCPGQFQISTTAGILGVEEGSENSESVLSTSSISSIFSPQITAPQDILKSGPSPPSRSCSQKSKSSPRRKASRCRPPSFAESPTHHPETISPKKNPSRHTRRKRRLQSSSRRPCRECEHDEEQFSRKFRCLLSCEKSLQGRELNFSALENLSNAQLRVNVFSHDVGQDVSITIVLPIVISEIYWVWSAAPQYNNPELLGQWLVESTKLDFFAERIENISMGYDLFITTASCYLKHMLNKFARRIQLSFLFYRSKINQRNNDRRSRMKPPPHRVVEEVGRPVSSPKTRCLVYADECDISLMRKELLSHIALDLAAHFNGQNLSPIDSTQEMETHSDASVSSLGNRSLDCCLSHSCNSMMDNNDESTYASQQVTIGSKPISESPRSCSSSKNMSKFQMLRSCDDVKSWQLRKVQVVDAYFPSCLSQPS